jgi:hypothetical protein
LEGIRELPGASFRRAPTLGGVYVIFPSPWDFSSNINFELDRLYARQV